MVEIPGLPLVLRIVDSRDTPAGRYHNRRASSQLRCAGHSRWIFFLRSLDTRCSVGHPTFDPEGCSRLGRHRCSEYTSHNDRKENTDRAGVEYRAAARRAGSMSRVVGGSNRCSCLSIPGPLFGQARVRAKGLCLYRCGASPLCSTGPRLFGQGSPSDPSRRCGNRLPGHRKRFEQVKLGCWRRSPGGGTSSHIQGWIGIQGEWPAGRRGDGELARMRDSSCSRGSPFRANAGKRQNVRGDRVL